MQSPSLIDDDGVAVIAECVIDRRDEVADVYWIILRFRAELVAAAVNLTTHDSTAGQQRAINRPLVIARSIRIY